MDLGLAQGIYSNKLEGNATGLYDSIRTGLHNGIYNENIIENGIVKNGLVLYHNAANNLSYSGGTSIKDLTGNNYTGVLNNGAYWSPLFKGCINYDGIDDFTTMGNILNSVFAGTNNKFTIVSWVYRNSDSAQGTVMSKLYTVLNERMFTLAYRNGIFELATYGKPDTISGGWIRLVAMVNTIPPQRWYQVCCTYDGSINTNDGLDRVKIYVNGISQLLQLTFTFNALDNTITSTTSQLAIGASVGSNGASQGYWEGRVAQSLVYNRLLSAHEVNQNYLATKARFGY